MRRLLTTTLFFALASCSTRERTAGDSTAIDTARARQAAGDLSAPATVDSASRPVTSSPTGEPPTRGDGRATNPPIHRTNPRDEDVMNPGSGAGGDDRAAALLAEVQRLAKSDGCSAVGDCRTLPVGRKACGGPRSYVVFCAKTTDVAALERKIAELDALDQAAAARGAVSDCMLALRPTPVLTGGVCRGAP